MYANNVTLQRPSTFASAAAASGCIEPTQTKPHGAIHQVSSSVDSGTTDLSLMDSTSYVKAPPVDGFLAAAQQSAFHTFLPQAAGGGGVKFNNGEWEASEHSFKIQLRCQQFGI